MYNDPQQKLGNLGRHEDSTPLIDQRQPVRALTLADRKLDWLITIASMWTMTGLFIDGHEHLFESVETFFNPWHLTMYSGGVFAVIVLAVTIARNRRGRSFWKAVPTGYEQSVAGVACLLIGGSIDFLWHTAFGFEHQLDLLVSPPHLFLLTGLFFLVSGPVRSGFARSAKGTKLFDQLPMIISLGLSFQVLQFVTQIAFYPEALMRDHPLSQIAFPSDQFALSTFLFYRQSLEIITVIWQSALLSAAIVYLVARTQLRFGALAVLCVVEKLWIGGELSRDLYELELIVCASAAAGILGDLILAKTRASLRNPNGLRIVGFAVPATYFASYFVLAVPLFGGTWWNASFVFGAILEAGIVGVCVTQLFLAGSEPRATIA